MFRKWRPRFLAAEVPYASSVFQFDSPWLLYSMSLLPYTKNCRFCMHRECRERFLHRRLQRKPRVSDPSMYHGANVTHVPWCMSRSLTYGGRENVPYIPGACATRNFPYLVRGPCHEYCQASLYKSINQTTAICPKRYAHSFVMLHTSFSAFKLSFSCGFFTREIRGYLWRIMTGMRGCCLSSSRGSRANDAFKTRAYRWFWRNHSPCSRG